MSGLTEQLLAVFRQGIPCLFHLVTGLYCPGCGGTRAVLALFDGHVALSLRYHPLVLYGVLVLVLELGSWLFARAAKNPRLYLGHVNLWIYIGVAIILLNWAFKNYMLIFEGVDLLTP